MVRDYGEKGRCEAQNRKGERCGQPAMDNGKCRFHGGLSTGAPEGNQNGQRHGLYSSRDGYYQDLDDDDKEWLERLTCCFLDRMGGEDETDMIDEEMAKSLAIDLHKVTTANSYFSREGITQTQQRAQDGQVFSDDIVNTWAKELRMHNQSIVSRMQKLGILDDPLSQQADAQQSLATVLSAGTPGLDGE